MRHETASRELITWINDQPDQPLVASVLVEVEVSRALRRVAPDSIPAIPATLARLYRVEIDESVRAAAAAFADPALRSLDAIHLATAAAVSDELSAFVTYDQRLLLAAKGLGFPVASPGGGGR